MKKSLLAVAAIGAFASAAQAQSSVTVYGILDVGFQGVSTRGPASQTVTDTAKTNLTRFSGEGSESTSRLGFKGTEDLGGGTAAFFTAEFALSPTDATLSGSTGNGLSNRQTFVGLSKKGIGQAAIGTQYTPIHTAVSRTDAGQQNNMIGDVIYATNASQGNGQTTTAYTVRYNNALTLQTERVAGFQANLIYNNNNSTSNATPATSQVTLTNTGTAAAAVAAALGVSQANNTAFGGGINYVWQKLNVDAAYLASKNVTISGAAQGTPALPASAAAGGVNYPANPLGTNIGYTQQYYAASYDFGILKAFGQYINTKATSNVNNSAYIQRTAQQIGVRSFVTPTIEAWASAGTGRFTGNGTGIAAGNPTLNFTGYQVGSNYWLSKRTNMYAIFGSTQASASSAAVSEGANSYGVGVRHTF